MGLYLEPQGDKAEWIRREGMPTTRGEWKSKESGQVVIAYCPVPFKSLAVIFDKREAQRYANGRDDAQWYSVAAKVVEELVGRAQWKYIK